MGTFCHASADKSKAGNFTGLLPWSKVAVELPDEV
jgi:hypothetical protein